MKPCSLMWAALVALPATAWAADRNDFNVEYYTVSGATVQELRNELNTLGPIGRSGAISEGNTRSRIEWRFDFDKKDGTCTVKEAFVDVTIQMVLPRWQRPPGVDQDLVSHWNRYISALRLHEDGHRYIVEAMAREVRRTLAVKSSAPDCTALRNQMNSRARALVQELERKQADYDRQTGNGKTQGVWLPERLPPELGQDDGR
jgi:predicted secreted Zn-dependent protease